LTAGKTGARFGNLEAGLFETAYYREPGMIIFPAFALSSRFCILAAFFSLGVLDGAVFADLWLLLFSFDMIEVPGMK
jgi:hypothetical protein